MLKEVYLSYKVLNIKIGPYDVVLSKSELVFQWVLGLQAKWEVCFSRGMTLRCY